MASPMENIGKTRRGSAARNFETEYGGGPGTPLSGAADGSVEHVLTAGEKARVVRTYGIRTPSGETTLTGEVWEEGELRRMEAEEHVNGRQVEEGLA